MLGVSERTAGATAAASSCVVITGRRYTVDSAGVLPTRSAVTPERRGGRAQAGQKGVRAPLEVCDVPLAVQGL